MQVFIAVARQNVWRQFVFDLVMELPTIYKKACVSSVVWCAVMMLDLAPDWLLYNPWWNVCSLFASTYSWGRKGDLDECAGIHLTILIGIFLLFFLMIFCCWLLAKLVTMFNLIKLGWYYNRPSFSVLYRLISWYKKGVSSSPKKLKEANDYNDKEAKLSSILLETTSLLPDLCHIVTSYCCRKSKFLDSSCKLYTNGIYAPYPLLRKVIGVRIVPDEEKQGKARGLKVIVDFDDGSNMSRTLSGCTGTYMVEPVQVKQFFPNLLVAYINDTPRLLPIKSATWNDGFAFWCYGQGQNDEELLVLGQPYSFLNWVSTSERVNVSSEWQLEEDAKAEAEVEAEE